MEREIVVDITVFHMRCLLLVIVLFSKRRVNPGDNFGAAIIFWPPFLPPDHWGPRSHLQVDEQNRGRAVLGGVNEATFAQTVSSSNHQ